MNLGAVQIALRERGALETMDLTLPFVRRLGSRVYLSLSLYLLLPMFVILNVLHYAASISWLVVWCVAVAFTTVTQGVFTVAAGQLMFSSSVRVKDVLRQYRENFGVYVRALLISRFLTALALATIVLAPILAAQYLFIHEVVLLEGMRVRSLERSRALATQGGAPGFVFGLCMLSATLFLIAISDFVGNAIVTEVLELRSLGSLWTEGGSVFALAGFFLSIPLMATARFLAYVDQRTRTDAWDVQVRFLRIRAAADLA
jgi:hypothetical protein